MSQDFKKILGPYATKCNGVTLANGARTVPVLERLQVEVGFTCMLGNKGPHFSIGHHAQEARLVGGQLVVRKDGGESFGVFSQIPSDVPELDFLRPALPFHLFDPDHGPMHYEANALYWLHLETGEITRREYDPDPWQTFLDHVCWGTLAGDKEAELARLKLDLTQVSDDARKLWLQNRLPKLIERFHQIVEEIGLSSELGAAKQWFAEAV